MINYISLLKSNPQYFRQFTCRELLFLSYDCPVKQTKLAKWSEYNYFYYVLSGQKALHTPRKSWLLTAGTLSLVKRGACLVEQFFGEPFCIVVFVLPDSFISRFVVSNKEQLPVINASSVKDDLVLPVKTNDMLHKFYESILPYFTANTPPSEKLIELKFTELLIHIVNNPENVELITYMQEVAAQKSVMLEHVMEANFPYNLTLGEYATLCNRSLSSFKRDFQTIYKTTPGRWLLKKRLERAEQLLTATGKPLPDVMLESGFENQAHFSKAFKAYFGCSPANYKRTLLHDVA
ncbi:MAG TPA: AraC family transcriptional regulator [Ohtaekwangia sp.]|uniref:helix-turn-helix domain-containing protein n=1 Tax=Ohtaekwangia sp. TaxID=2066019 RepID=UPI002F95C4EB